MGPFNLFNFLPAAAAAQQPTQAPDGLSNADIGALLDAAQEQYQGGGQPGITPGNPADYPPAVSFNQAAMQQVPPADHGGIDPDIALAAQASRERPSTQPTQTPQQDAPPAPGASSADLLSSIPDTITQRSTTTQKTIRDPAVHRAAEKKQQAIEAAAEAERAAVDAQIERQKEMRKQFRAARVERRIADLKYENDVEGIDLKAREKYNELEKASDDINSEIDAAMANMDPSKAMDQFSPVQKIFFALGSALMGFAGQGAQAMQMINGITDRYIKMQKFKVAKGEKKLDRLDQKFAMVDKKVADEKDRAAIKRNMTLSEIQDGLDIMVKEGQIDQRTAAQMHAGIEMQKADGLLDTAVKTSETTTVQSTATTVANPVKKELVDALDLKGNGGQIEDPVSRRKYFEEAGELKKFLVQLDAADQQLAKLPDGQNIGLAKIWNRDVKRFRDFADTLAGALAKGPGGESGNLTAEDKEIWRALLHGDDGTVLGMMTNKQDVQKVHRVLRKLIKDAAVATRDKYTMTPDQLHNSIVGGDKPQTHGMSR